MHRRPNAAGVSPRAANTVSVDARGGRNRDGGLRPGDERLALGAEPGVAQEQLAPAGGLAPAFEPAAIDQRPAIEVVIHVAGKDEPVHEWCAEEQLLEAPQRPEPDQITAGNANEVLPDVKAPVLVRSIDLARDLDAPRIADSQPLLVRQADVGNRHR